MPHTPRPAAPTGPAELAVVRRSGFVESRHVGSLLALDTDGSVAAELGEVDAPVLARSTAKPLQALACLLAGAPLEGAALAVAAGSHTGTDAHVAVVRAVLAGAGLTEDALRCPVDRPEDEATREALVRAGEPPSRVRMNCSGKHAAMLSACRVNGWSTDDHLDPDHPLQQRVRAVTADLTGVPVSRTAVDGCGAPLFATTVRGLATAFRALRLADPASPAGRVAAAMSAHPEFVGGPGHPNTEVVRRVPGTLAKGGAEGVIAVAGPGGRAVALKVADGNPRATTLVALEVLAGLGVDVSGARDLLVVPVLGGGVRVGEVAAGAAVRQWVQSARGTEGR